LNIIDFENIYVSYDVKPVLKGINLKVKSGEHLAILGANGSGKTTLMKLFSNDLYPNVSYKFKKEIFGRQRWSIFELKKKLGIITNDLHNYFEKQGAFLSGYEVILSGYYSSIGIFKHQDFSDDWHKKARETMAAFVLDEPTSGLDIKAQISFINLLRKLSKKVTIILITHHIEEIFKETKNVALINEQSIYKYGNKEEILTSENLSKIFDTKLSVKCENDRYFYDKVE